MKIWRLAMTAAGRRLRRHCAAGEYFRLDRRAGQIMWHLSHPMDPLERAALLDDLAWYEQQMADIHMAAFGPDALEHEGGRDMSESLALSARLLRIVADVAGQLGSDELTGPREGMTADQLAAIGRLSRATGPAERAAILDEDMYAAFAGQAAEVLVSLARCERAAARPGRRPYRPRRSPPLWARPWLKNAAGDQP